jgi:hypothetical protein
MTNNNETKKYPWKQRMKSTLGKKMFLLIDGEHFLLLVYPTKHKLNHTLQNQIENTYHRKVALEDIERLVIDAQKELQNMPVQTAEQAEEIMVAPKSKTKRKQPTLSDITPDDVKAMATTTSTN